VRWEITEIVYQPMGPNIGRELERFIGAVKQRCPLCAHAVDGLRG
jgi:hypothetical protein